MFIDFGNKITPTKMISSYMLSKSSVGVLTQQSNRSCWGIALKTSGKTYYTQNGKRILSDQNHVILLPKGSCYTWKCFEQGECILINFDALEVGDTIYSIEVNDNSFILSAFLEIERCLNLDDSISQLSAMQQLYGILLFLAKATNKKYIPKDKQHRLSPAIDYMKEHYSDSQITNEFLATLCGMSTVYFRKTFEIVYGCPPIRYLHELRINKAKSILIGDYDSIAQIAESVGYSNVYHFSKMFRKYTNLSPTQFAKSNVEKSGPTP